MFKISTCTSRILPRKILFAKNQLVIRKYSNLPIKDVKTADKIILLYKRGFVLTSGITSLILFLNDPNTKQYPFTSMLNNIINGSIYGLIWPLTVPFVLSYNLDRMYNKLRR